MYSHQDNREAFKQITRELVLIILDERASHSKHYSYFNRRTDIFHGMNTIHTNIFPRRSL